MNKITCLFVGVKKCQWARHETAKQDGYEQNKSYRGRVSHQQFQVIGYKKSSEDGADLGTRRSILTRPTTCLSVKTGCQWRAQFSSFHHWGKKGKMMVLSKYKCYTKRSNSLLWSNLTLSLQDPCEVTFQMYALKGTSYLTSTCFLSTTVPTTIGYCKDYLKKDM